MITYACIPLVCRPLPVYARPCAVYATVTNPWSHEDQRVKLEALRLVRDTTTEMFFVVDVISIEAHVSQGYSVKPEDIRQLSVMVRYEYEEV